MLPVVVVFWCPRPAAGQIDGDVAVANASRDGIFVGILQCR